MKYERLLLGADDVQHQHASRLHRLAEAGVSWDEYRAIHDRVQADYYKPRSAEQLADDEAAITGLEARHTGALAELRRKRRAARLKAFKVSIATADEDLIARDALTETRVLKSTRTWLDGDKPLLSLSGSCGLGKTVAGAVALLRLGGEYIRAIDASRMFMAAFGDEVEQRERLRVAQGVVVVDDIGTERNADAMGVALIELLDARRRDGMRNLWITNLSRADFEARYPDSRLHSRMAQSAVWCIDTGADLRRAK